MLLSCSCRRLTDRCHAIRWRLPGPVFPLWSGRPHGLWHVSIGSLLLRFPRLVAPDWPAVFVMPSGLWCWPHSVGWHVPFARNECFCVCRRCPALVDKACPCARGGKACGHAVRAGCPDHKEDVPGPVSCKMTKGPAVQAGPRASRTASGGQCAWAAAAPIPVWARTYWSSNASRSRLACRLPSSTETSMVTMKARGIENSAGCS